MRTTITSSKIGDPRSASIIQHAYILAGGQSRRMGCDKLFLGVDDSPLLAKTLDTCRLRFSAVTIVARTTAKFHGLSCRVLLDTPGFPGPVGGVIAALEDCPDMACFITAADLADLSAAILDELFDAYNDEEYLGLQKDSFIQPLCGIYQSNVAGVLRAVAAENQYSLRRLMASLTTRFIAVPQRWRNINSPEDLSKE